METKTHPPPPQRLARDLAVRDIDKIAWHDLIRSKTLVLGEALSSGLSPEISEL